MDNQKSSFSKDEPLSFAKEEPLGKGLPQAENFFKLLIVDDEKEIHSMTKLVLKDYQYKDYHIDFLSAYSGRQAKEMVKADPDIACCLLDVVMETNDAGLEVARYIREEIKNTKMRIILRTGQPGNAPEKEVILNYDINDYKEKTELTTQKLFTTMTTALRSYLHLVELEEKNQEIQSKNIRLNEEIARRIVAESNLTKYNRSLERMIEDKTQRLTQALQSLEDAEKQLFVTQQAAIVSDMSSVSLESIASNNSSMDSNIRKMNLYRQQMTFLLGKYNTLETILTNHQETKEAMKMATEKNIEEIQSYKNKIDLNTLLEQYPEIIEDSLKGIEQISRAIHDIRMFVSINEEANKEVNINYLLKKAAGVQSHAHKKIDIQLDLADLPVQNLPESNFYNAIREVLDNAFHAVDGKGIISVTSRMDENQILIKIRDIGKGISKDMCSKIFIPYFKGWEKGGKGLGLSFAKSVLLSCGGDLKISSTSNEGTTVSICLPVQN